MGASMPSRKVRGLGSCLWGTKWLAGEEGIEPSLARFWRPPLLPVSYTPDIWHRLPVTIQRLCGHNAALCH
jgi:hypothetical protein